MRFEARVETCGADKRSRARLLALTAKHTSAWLYSSCFTTALRLWLPKPSFYLVIRFRLGLEIGPEQPCALCFGKERSDALGSHSLSCRFNGGKTLMHAAVLDEIMRLATAADANPRREVHAFPKHPHLRMDAVFSLPCDRMHANLVDVAITNCLCESTLRHESCYGPGRAATEYEQLKRRSYAEAMAEERPSDTLVPLVYDVFGGCGDSGSPVVAQLIEHRTRRAELPRVTVARMVHHRINFVIVESVAKILGANALRSDLDLQDSAAS
jgi:hypothetical protein